MSKVATVDILSTDWGYFNCPPDLMELWKKAPKIRVEYIDEDGHPNSREIVDQTTAAGSAALARERELLNAINLIFGTGVLDVVNAEKPA